MVTHTLRVDSQCQDVQALDEYFWDLESFGISPQSDSDVSVYEEFEGSVCFVDWRYQVQLPCKELHPPLANHYDLCMKRLQGLI